MRRLVSLLGWALFFEGVGSDKQTENTRPCVGPKTFFAPVSWVHQNASVSYPSGILGKQRPQKVSIHDVHDAAEGPQGEELDDPARIHQVHAAPEVPNGRPGIVVADPHQAPKGPARRVVRGVEVGERVEAEGVLREAVLVPEPRDALDGGPVIPDAVERASLGVEQDRKSTRLNS